MILALVAMLAIAGSAFGAGRYTAVAPNATFTNGQAPTTTNNDDSCDISVIPAATLLLPIFDVNLTAAAGASDTTLFTITNVSALPQIAHVTVWTDWSFPVLDFNIFLTGYDVQSINLYDVLVRGIIAPGGPGTSSTNTTISPLAPQGSATSGSTPFDNDDNPNIDDFVIDNTCAGTNLPGALPPELMDAVRTALTTGVYVIAGGPAGASCTSAQRVGGVHSNARGYITLDVANNCSIALPTNPDYYATEILFDNVLIGDYQQINGDTTVGNFAQGNPMVHIRAVPEGGQNEGLASAPVPVTNLPYTFYDRYTPSTNRRIDRRQPLPSTFAARWIEGGTSGFQTNYKIWREGVNVASCANATANSAMPVDEVIRFDERENSFGFVGGVICSPTCVPNEPRLNEASITSTTNTAIYPANGSSVDIAGWMYLNLDNQPPNHSAYSFNGAPCSGCRDSQNWVIVSLFAQGRFSVDFDAAMLGNGCSAAEEDPSSEIGPAGGVLVCPFGAPASACDLEDPTDHPYSGTNVTP
jgi:hypothetical protein